MDIYMIHRYVFIHTHACIQLHVYKSEHTSTQTESKVNTNSYFQEKSKLNLFFIGNYLLHLHGACLGVRRQHSRVSSLLLLCCQAWGQVPLPTEPLQATMLHH